MEGLEPADSPSAPLRNRFRNDIGLMMVSQAVGIALTMASAALVARALGPSGRGIYAVAFAVVNMLVQFGSVGLPTSNTHFIAQLHNRSRLISNSIWFAAALGTLLIAIGCGLKVWAPSVTKGLGWTELLVALPSVPFALLAMFMRAVLLGEGRTIAYNFVDIAVGIGAFLTLAAGLAIWDFGVTELLALLTGSYVISGISYVILLVGTSNPLRPLEIALARDLLKYGLKIYVAGLMFFLVINVDLLMVNAYLGAESAGYYSAVAAMVSALTVLPVVVGVNLFPRISSGGDHDMTSGVFRTVAALYGLICLISIPLAYPTSILLFGSDFTEVAGIYYWIIPGAFSLGMISILSHHFAGRGYPLEVVLIWIPGVAINIAINLLFLKHGTYVAALSSSVTYGLILVLHAKMFAREAGGYGALVPRPRETYDVLRTALPNLRRRSA